MREEWKHINFKKCLIKVPKQRSIKSRDYLGQGAFPIVSQESRLISGYTDDGSLLYTHDRPVVIFGDHTKNIKYIDFDFAVGADGVHILMTIDEIIPKFFYYQLCSIKLRDLGYARHYKLLKETDIKYPNLSEQERIVSLIDKQFDIVEKIRSNAEAQLNHARQLFSSALEDLLTIKEGWIEKTLDSIATDMYRGSGITRDQTRDDGIPCVRYGEIYTKYNYWFDKCVTHTDESIVKGKKYFEYGDILFAITGESVEEIGKSIAYLGEDICLAGGDIVVLKHNQNPKYLSYALSSRRAIEQKGHGKTKLKVVHTNIPSLKSIVIPIPPTLDVQEQISNKLDILAQKVKELEDNYNKTITLCNDLKQSLLKTIFE